MAPNIGEDFVRWRPPPVATKLLGLVDFCRSFRTLDHETCRKNTMADAEKWAAGMSVPAYAIDDQTPSKVVDGAVDVISEGH